MPRELAECVEGANLDQSVHVIALAGSGKGFCGGYDLVEYAERRRRTMIRPAVGPGHRLADDESQPARSWSLFHSDKPVACKVHGFCVAGGTDMALCSDLLMIADDARIGYPPARVWGVPTSALWAFRVGDQRAKRLLFTGDLIDGRTHTSGGSRSKRPGHQLDDRFEELVERHRAHAGEPARDDEAAGQPSAVLPGPPRPRRRSACSSTASPDTRPRVTRSSSAPPEAGFKQAVLERDERIAGSTQ